MTSRLGQSATTAVTWWSQSHSAVRSTGASPGDGKTSGSSAASTLARDLVRPLVPADPTKAEQQDVAGFERYALIAERGLDLVDVHRLVRVLA